MQEYEPDPLTSDSKSNLLGYSSIERILRPDRNHLASSGAEDKIAAAITGLARSVSPRSSFEESEEEAREYQSKRYVISWR